MLNLKEIAIERGVSIEQQFTDTYKQHMDSHKSIREAKCLEVLFPASLGDIQEGDLFAGRIEPPLIGFSPDEWGQTAFGYYCEKDAIKELLNGDSISAQDKETLSELLEFWKTENTSTKLRNRYPDKMSEYLPSDNWMGDSGIAFPLYRLTGGNINYRKLLSLGIPGMMEEIQRQKASANGDPEFYDGARIVMEAFINSAHWYAEQARSKADKTSDDQRAADLRDMAQALENITQRTPETFREAIQLFWLYSTISDVRNHGRMDVYLGDFLANDLNQGRLTDAEALRLLQSLWQLMADKDTVVHNRVIIGGKGRPNEENADRFALLAMEATRTVLEAEPQLSLRFYDGQNPELMEKALDVIAEGRTFPMLYNDDVNIPSVQKAFGFSEDLAEQYVPYGCGEYIIDHKSFGTPSGVINLLKALEVTLHNGWDPYDERKMGLSLGTFEEFRTFEDLWDAYKEQVEHSVEIMADQESLEYEVAGEEASYLYMSLLYDGCLERGKGMFSGGIDYLGGTLETYGNTNIADSLTAIKQLVYEDERMSKSELLEALDSNFERYEDVRRLLRNAPKYGNDDPVADEMYLRVHNHVCNYVRKQKDRTDLHSYLVVNINNSANTLMGRQTSASADGRLAGTSMANGNNPTSGYDENGITAFLNSIAKPATDIHAGAVQNMKFGPEMFTKHREKLESLLETHFDNGAQQAMISVVDKNILEQALNEPEKYRHVFVRVGGFSARFVDLDRDVQQEILERTLYQ
ncbi:MAG: hypothetical protein K9N57_00365 [Candidatus Marinimicrobia bacterium]|nr:hypothetical protein [Candidatus Neomarinimicrobiota bacterium]